MTIDGSSLTHQYPGIGAMRLPGPWEYGQSLRIVELQWSLTEGCQLAIQSLMESVIANSENLIIYLVGVYSLQSDRRLLFHLTSGNFLLLYLFVAVHFRVLIKRFNFSTNYGQFNYHREKIPERYLIMKKFFLLS